VLKVKKWVNIGQTCVPRSDLCCMKFVLIYVVMNPEITRLVEEFYALDVGAHVSRYQESLVFFSGSIQVHVTRRALKHIVEQRSIKAKKVARTKITPKGYFRLGGRNSPPLPRGPAALRFPAFQYHKYTYAQSSCQCTLALWVAHCKL
jgi:hypothetical protein